MRKNKKNNPRRTGITGLLFTLALLIISSANGIAADPPGIPDGWSDGFAYVNGVRIHYYHAVPAPGKPVIVMVHGVTDIGLCWTTLTWKLQNDYDIYMLDARGHGLSDPFTSSDDGETLVKDVVGFVKAMNFEKPILIGHSMGAATVMRVGAEYPELARIIIMFDPFLASFNPEGRVHTSRTPPGTPKKEAKDTTQSEKSSQKLSVNMFGDPETLVAQNNYSFEDLVELGRRQNPKWDIVDIKYWALSKKQYHGAYTQEAWQAMSGTMKTEDALARITVPSLILKADASPEGRKANEVAVKNLPLVKLVHVDGAAHNLHHDELEFTVKALNDFLSSVL
ncbi:MAG: alpha/beta hydrolase [Bacteroidales bacterium]|nr:alpha/beta hydrolase [Bacteroidales bacterium]